MNILKVSYFLVAILPFFGYASSNVSTTDTTQAYKEVGYRDNGGNRGRDSGGYHGYNRENGGYHGYNNDSRDRNYSDDQWNRNGDANVNFEGGGGGYDGGGDGNTYYVNPDGANQLYNEESQQMQSPY